MRTRSGLLREFAVWVGRTSFPGPPPYFVTVKDNEFVLRNGTFRPEGEEFVCKYEHNWKYNGPPGDVWCEIDSMLKQLWKEGKLCPR